MGGTVLTEALASLEGNILVLTKPFFLEMFPNFLRIKGHKHPKKKEKSVGTATCVTNGKIDSQGNKPLACFTATEL